MSTFRSNLRPIVELRCERVRRPTPYLLAPAGRWPSLRPCKCTVGVGFFMVKKAKGGSCNTDNRYRLPRCMLYDETAYLTYSSCPIVQDDTPSVHSLFSNSPYCICCESLAYTPTHTHTYLRVKYTSRAILPQIDLFSDETVVILQRGFAGLKPPPTES